jgi:hypothetical protein
MMTQRVALIAYDECGRMLGHTLLSAFREFIPTRTLPFSCVVHVFFHDRSMLRLDHG